ncbi:MAG: FAD-dependent oxidoreductase [Acidimicrobiales bacterium]
MAPSQSLWWSSLDPVVPRPVLQRHLDVDVAIVGGGFTGLWTARELLRRDGGLRVAVFEKEVCGFGASGRNGGWASGLFPLSNASVIRRYGRESFDHQRHVLQDAVRELGSCARDDLIDARFVHGGTMTFARSEIQRARLLDELSAARDVGIGDGDLAWLDEAELGAHGRVAGALGALFSPHCARIDPARLVRGLADVDEQLGAVIFEHTAVTRIIPGRAGRRAEVVTIGANVHADYVIRATEGFTPNLPRERRTIVPLYSLMIATEPLSSDFWDEAGFAHCETFADDRHLIIYGQRTDDGRIAFGGRGAPYHFGSSVEARFDTNHKVFMNLEATLRELFPSMNGSITNAWGGPLAMPRDHAPFVRVDFDSGLASAGGYTGDGVVLSRVAASALADLITSPDTQSAFTRLPFVQRTGKRWEFEPFRWIGINAGLALANWADRVETEHGTVSRASRWLDRLVD